MEQQSPAATMARTLWSFRPSTVLRWRFLRVNPIVNALYVSWGCHRMSAFKPQILPPLILVARGHNGVSEWLAFPRDSFLHLEM